MRGFGMRVLLLPLIISACLSSSAAGQNARTDFSIQSELPGDLKSVLPSLQKSLEESIATKRGKSLAVEIERLRVPEYKSWFAGLFGATNGALLAPVYAKTYQKEEHRLTDFFTANAQPGGQLVANIVSGSSEPPKTEYQQRFDAAVRNALTRPAIVYDLEYRWTLAGSPSPYNFSFGYIVSVDGVYRLIGESVLRALPGMPPRRIRQGGPIVEQSLISKVKPESPVDANNQHLAGIVRLHIVIGTDGSVKSLEVMSGHPLLVQAATDAVKQWKYRPTTLNGEPVEVDTVVEIIFNH